MHVNWLCGFLPNASLLQSVSFSPELSQVGRCVLVGVWVLRLFCFVGFLFVCLVGFLLLLGFVCFCLFVFGENGIFDSISNVCGNVIL